MAVSGSKIDLILGLKLNEFFQANDKAWAKFSKTKGKIEGKPIRFKATGGKELLTQIGKIYAAYMVITRLVPNLIKLSDIQEKAENRLVTALKNAGAATQENIDKQMVFASWIQKVTTVGDEQSLMMQAMALNMQAPEERIEEVTKNAIALSKAFELDMNVAMRASVSALNDNYTMLTRYIPALRTATSEAEKAAIYQRSVADGWKIATEELKTNAGTMEDFGNTIGDLKEDLGDFIKTVLVPLIRTIEPVIGGFTDLSKSTQTAILATTLFIAIGVKVPAMLVAVRASIMALHTSLGPVGWLIIGISAAAAAWGAYTLGAENAAEANKKFGKSVITDVESHIELLKKGLGDVAAKDIDELIKIREKLYLRMQWALQKNNEKLYNAYKSHYENVGKLIERHEQDLRKKRDKEKDEIKPPVEIYTPEDVKRIELAQGEITAGTQDFYFNLAEIRTGFQDMGMQEMDDEYARRSNLLEDYMTNVENTLGRESEAYKQLMLKKWAMDLNREKQKKALEEKALRHMASMGSEMMATFQSQNVTLFEIGKALAIANMVIQKAEAITKAISYYPWPFNLGVAAIQAALVAGQIANVLNVKYQPKGKAAGGLISYSDIVNGAFVPPDEDGYIAAQIGEMVINRKSTREFLPLLEQINKSGKRGFQEGGIVGSEDLAGESGEGTMLLYAMIQDAIIQGFSKSQLKVTGKFTARGRDLQAAFDKNEELKQKL